MRAAILTLGLALAVRPAAAGEKPTAAQEQQTPAESKAQEGQTSNPKPGEGSGATRDGKRDKLEGYGYGTPSGVEAHGSAGQPVQKKLKKGTTPQEEQRTPARRKGKKAKGAAGAAHAHAPSPDVPNSSAASPTPPRSATQQQGDPQR